MVDRSIGSYKSYAVYWFSSYMNVKGYKLLLDKRAKLNISRSVFYVGFGEG